MASLALPKGKLNIGLNTGAGLKFANKAWNLSSFIELIRRIKRELDVNVLLLGGQLEKERNREIFLNCKDLVFNTGIDHTVRQFALIVNVCDIIVSADTLAMHIAIALKKKVLALFGPTCAQEIDLYDRGIKIISHLDCRPCYKKRCNKSPNCMDSITPEEVYGSLRRLLNMC
ncbi:MAG: glycosyltransferase family 9 protein [Candidatus Omnitrophica bacterium]|nr:glycosyltransferase family 9 protein [Candidatus Omnitrophota bacterium]